MSSTQDDVAACGHSLFHHAFLAFEDGHDTRGWAMRHGQRDHFASRGAGRSAYAQSLQRGQLYLDKDEASARSKRGAVAATRARDCHQHRQEGPAALKRGAVAARGARVEVELLNECRRIVGATAQHTPDDNYLPECADLVLKAPLATLTPTPSQATPNDASEIVIQKESPRRAEGKLSQNIRGLDCVDSCASSHALSIILTNGEPFMSGLDFEPEAPVSQLIKRIQGVLASNFQLITESGEMLPLGEEAESHQLQDFGVEDGSVLYIAVGKMTIAGQNALTRLQRLERDVERFRSLHGDRRAAKALFTRLKGTDDEELRRTLGNDFVYKIAARKFVNDLCLRVDLKYLSDKDVKSLMLLSMETGNGALNLHDFRLFYTRVMSLCLEKLEQDLVNERAGVESYERWFRSELSSCARDFYSVTCRCRSVDTTYRFWKADACYQSLSYSYFSDPYVRFTGGRRMQAVLREGLFEILGDKIELSVEKAARCHMSKELSQEDAAKIAPEGLRRAHAYQPRQYRVALEAWRNRTTLSAWEDATLSQRGMKYPLDIQLLKECIISSKTPKPQLALPDGQVAFALRTFNFSHGRVGTDGF